MKKYCFLILIMFLHTLSVSSNVIDKGEAYKITILKGNIKADGIEKSQDDTIYGNQAITFAEGQTMRIINIKTELPLQITQAAFSRLDVKTIDEYREKISKNHGNSKIKIIRTGNPSTKSKKNDKIALIVGNSNYLNDSIFSPLKNPINDAEDIALKLSSLGYDICPAFDLNYESFKNTLQSFKKEAENKKTVIFYYTGHGYQKDNINYLIPIDINTDLIDSTNSVTVNEILTLIDSIKCEYGLMFFDACRDTETTDKRSDHTFVLLNVGDGRLLMYSTQPNQIALDYINIEDRNSPFASELLSQLDEVNKKISDINQTIRDNVFKKTSKKEQPSYSVNYQTDNYIIHPQDINPIVNDNHTNYYAGFSMGYPNISTYVGLSTPHNLLFEGGVSFYYMTKPIDVSIDNVQKKYTIPIPRIFLRTGYLYSKENFNLAALFEFSYIGIKGENVIKEATEDIGSRATSFTITPNLRAAWNLNKKIQIHFTLGYDKGVGDKNYGKLSEICPSIKNYSNGVKVNAGINYIF